MKTDCEINETHAKRHSSLENIETRNDSIFKPWDMKTDEYAFDEFENNITRENIIHDIIEEEEEI